MSNGSFYGGRRGASFVIVKSYPDIISMTLDFSKGGNFSEVKYDEYVMINTLNKSHPDNGKIFRRGYDYNSDRVITGYRTYNEEGIEIINGTEEEYRNAKYEFDNSINAGGALYIGTVVGPSGNAPFLSITPYDEVINYYNKAPEEMRVKSSGSISNNDLLPGKKADGTFNDDILWYSASIITDNLDNGYAYIGFKVPYMVIDFAVKEGSSYGEVKIDRIDNKQHPFYEAWEISIPVGKHGNTIRNIKKIHLENYFSGDSAIVASLPDIYLDPEQIEPMTAQDFSERGLSGDDDILVYEYWNYEKSDPPEEKLCFLAEYNQVSSVDILEDGTLTIAYTNENVDIFNKALSKITRLSYNDEKDSERGLLKIEYNTGENLSVPILYTDKIDLKDNGIIAYKNNLENDQILENPDENHILGELKWIKRVQYDDTEKTLRVFYNTQIENPETQEIQNEVDEFELQTVTDLKIEDNGEVKIRRGNNEWENIYDDSTPAALPRVLKWITDIVYNATEDQMQIYFNSDTEGQPSEIIPNAFNRITNVTFDEAVVFDDVTPAQTAPGFIITYSSGEITKVRFSTGKLIKSITLVPGERSISGGIITYTNSMLRITYTDNTIENLQLDGKMIDNLTVIEGPSSTTEEGYTIPTSSLRVTYDNTETEDLNFLYPRSIIVDNETIDNSHRVKVYDSQGNQIFQSSPINGISQIIIDNNRLLVLYDNPTARNAIPENRAVQIEQEDGSVLVWDNLGIVRTDSGILVGKNIEPSSIEQPFSTDEEIITYLNNNFPNGEVIGSLYHIITVGENNQNKKFYGFDTSAETWYYLGSIAESAIKKDCVTGTQEEFESVSDYKKSLLSAGGLYFIIKDDNN